MPGRQRCNHKATRPIMTNWKDSYQRTVLPAVDRSKSIDSVILAESCLAEAGAVFRQHFKTAAAVVIADETTYAVAGVQVCAALAAAGVAVSKHVLPAKPRVDPDRMIGDSIANHLRLATPNPPIAVAVGSGVLHDLTRYAAAQVKTSFMSVPTAASMDGYTSAGAPLSDKGFKITLQCAPPRVILADLDVIAAAPAAMSGWGFGDLAGKMPAGGDWLVADALGIEPIDGIAWPMVQYNLANWLSDPVGVRQGNKDAVADLFVGLAVSGIAMELHGSSRPASGADHQIAHIWEMEYLEHRGEKTSHGACVAIGCLTMLTLFDWLIGQDLSSLEPEAISRAAPAWPALEHSVRAAFANAEIADRAVLEMRDKHVERGVLAGRLQAFLDAWPILRERLSSHLMREADMRRLLSAAGAPATIEEIGLSPARHRATVMKARWIRKRYTLLDLLAEAGLLERAMAECFTDEHPLYARLQPGEAA
jgi:glycerol-1-phosphate dehydrogenase [NAD(P)+]